MKSGLDNEHGFALVFGMVILVLATVGGTALLFMTQKDRIEASDYAKMRSASQVAVAALKACEGQFQNDPNTALAILKKYKSDNAYKWMFGTDANANSEHKITLGSAAGAPQYSARIIGYEDKNQFVIIEGIGYINNGGKKKALASYQLAGLGMSDRAIGTGNGFFLGGQLMNCSAPMRLDGDAYLSMIGCTDCQHFNNGARINGNLKTGSTSNYLNVDKPMYISGKAFIRCGLWPQNTFQVTGKSGYERSFYNFSSTTYMQLLDDAYLNSPSWSTSGTIDMNGHTVKYSNSGLSLAKFTEESASSGSQSPLDIADLLDMNAGDETGFGLAIPSWGSGVVQSLSGCTVTGETVDGWWEAKKTAGKLYLDEWLVLQLTDWVTMNGGTFHKKVIWITGDKGINVGVNWYNCSNESNTLLIVNSTGILNDMGVYNNGNFRGLIYVTSTSNINYKCGTQTSFYGAIHHAGTGAFNLNTGGDSLRIKFSDPLAQSAIQEIVNTGIILAPGVSTPPARTLIVVDLKIRPTLISMQL